jgi:hypothetical protein
MSTPDHNRHRIVGACHREQLTELRGEFLANAQACSFAQSRAAPRKCGRLARRSCTLAVRITAQLALASCTKKMQANDWTLPGSGRRHDELTPWTLLPLAGSPSAQLESSKHEMQHLVYVNIEGMGIAITTSAPRHILCKLLIAFAQSASLPRTETYVCISAVVHTQKRNPNHRASGVVQPP